MQKGDYIFAGGEPRQDKDYWQIINAGEFNVIVENIDTGQFASIDTCIVQYDDGEWVCCRESVKVLGNG